MIQTGTVKRFNKIKGYGFIAADSDASEVFVHFSEVQTEGYKALIEGQRISYILATGDKGAFATNVTIIDNETQNARKEV